MAGLRGGRENEGVGTEEGQEGVAVGWAAQPLSLKYQSPFRAHQEYRVIQEIFPDWWTPHTDSKVKDPGLTPGL